MASLERNVTINLKFNTPKIYVKTVWFFFSIGKNFCFICVIHIHKISDLDHIDSLVA
jgi:hypothetical protein